MTDIKTFGATMDTFLAHARWADSTRAASKHIIDRDIQPVFRDKGYLIVDGTDGKAH